MVKKVYETIEIAGIPQTSRNAILEREGTGVLAPVKVKGENAWISQLGDMCYIGSDAEPIVQHLTSAASTSPLTGETVEGSTVWNSTITRGGQEVALVHSVLLDNTYAVPGAVHRSLLRIYSGHNRQDIRYPGGGRRQHHRNKRDAV